MATSLLRCLVGALLTLSSSSFHSFHSPLLRSSSLPPSPLCAPVTAAEDVSAEDAITLNAATDLGAEESSGSGSSSTSTSTRPLNPDPRLAALGYVRETMEEYEARRAATVQEHGGRVDKPETAEQYAARRRRNEKEKAARLARNAAYEAACSGPLPGRDFAEVQNGEVLSGCTFVSELHTGEAKKKKKKKKEEGGSSSSSDSGGKAGQERPKAWFDAGLWRRRAKDGQPVKVHACVRLWREDPVRLDPSECTGLMIDVLVLDG